MHLHIQEGRWPVKQTPSVFTNVTQETTGRNAVVVKVSRMFEQLTNR